METPLGNCNLLVVSDLHLSEGRDSRSKKFSKNEDFFFDEEFARFIAYYQDTTRWNCFAMSRTIDDTLRPTESDRLDSVNLEDVVGTTDWS